jgi:hypothetical protein
MWRKSTTCMSDECVVRDKRIATHRTHIVQDEQRKQFTPHTQRRVNRRIVDQRTNESGALQLAQRTQFRRTVALGDASKCQLKLMWKI